jgi:hypothetical protein
MLHRSAPRRLARLRYIEQLDPDRDYEEIYRIITGYEFPWNYWQSLSLAFFRTFAVPSISGLLDHTGELVAHTKKRADDTLLVMYEIGRLGLETSEGRAYIRRMNRMHQRYDISNDDSAYIMRWRGRLLRILPPRSDGRRHQLNLGTYQNGYRLGDVGPEWIRAENATTTKTSGAQS